MTPRPLSLRIGAAVALAAGTVLLTGCTATVPLQPAKDAVNPACADLIVRLPATVASVPQRETNAQATSAWGTPAAVLLHCGVTVPGPTTLPCLSINGIDWIEDVSGAPTYRYTTFGRDPATELVVDSTAVNGATVLVDLAAAVASIPATRKCLDIADVAVPTGPAAPVP